MRTGPEATSMREDDRTGAESVADAWTAQRKHLAQQIASGLAGWHQLHAAQNLTGLRGEDSARFIIAQIVNAHGRYKVQTSQRPSNWPTNSKLRMDIRLLGTSAGAAGWYGAVEAKWPGASFAVDPIRLALVQDVVRLITVTTQNLNARLLVLGGSDDAIGRIFDKPHPRAPKSEQMRAVIDALLPRTAGNTQSTKFSDVLAAFAQAEDRIPPSLRPACHGRVRVTCLSAEKAVMAGQTVGHVFVWQCSKSGGRRGGSPRRSARGSGRG